MGLLSFLIVGAIASSEFSLAEYAKKPDVNFSFTFSGTKEAPQITLKAHKWRGISWVHDLLVSSPSKLDIPGVAILYVTGGAPNPTDVAEANALAEASGMPCAMLYQIPNQPLFGKREDELIAFTFNQYLATGDNSWPLLLPMAKSGIRAMDAIQAVTKDSKNPISRFIVTGASKRGWTTYLMAASKDPRIIGIAPQVFDNLGFEMQMKHQLDSWGKYSDMIQDYNRLNLMDRMSTPRGKKLTAIVDPFLHLSNLTMPKLIVNGSNDPYWATDALSLYWELLPEPRTALILPNEGHTFKDDRKFLSSMAAFARACASGKSLPSTDRIELSWVTSKEPVSNISSRLMQIRFKVPFAASKVAIHISGSASKDFRQSEWKPTQLGPLDPGEQEFVLNVPVNAFLAGMVSYEGDFDGVPFTVSTPIQIIKSK